tara:strand:+ start:1543 stop:1755 length:213 start_codon:yes stop_codon:yes gene_type:complete
MKFEIVKKKHCYPCEVAIKHFTRIASERGIEILIKEGQAPKWPWFYVHENGIRREVTRDEFRDLLSIEKI